jgi:hypothetical protein
MSTELQRRHLISSKIPPIPVSSFVHFETVHRSEFRGGLQEICSNMRFKQSEMWCNPVQLFTGSVPTVRIQQITNIVDLPQQIFGEQI